MPRTNHSLIPALIAGAFFLSVGATNLFIGRANAQPPAYFETEVSAFYHDCRKCNPYYRTFRDSGREIMVPLDSFRQLYSGECDPNSHAVKTICEYRF